MKKLTKFFIKSFIGPFLATFFVSMFMLVMQFLWKYIDDLMGKGLEIGIILELLFYVSASLLPLALPLAILLSSLMVMGNLGEKLELTALKSSGLSIMRILRPLMGIAILIAIGTFYFSNYVIPVANYKWHSIIWDIQEKKMTAFLRPGIYSQEIDGFSMKIKEGKDNKFKNIIIHDRRSPQELKTIVADSGEYYQSENSEFIFFKLYNGSVIEELEQSPNFKNEDKSHKNFHPGRKSNFETATYKMDLSGFKLQRTKDELFKDDYEMLNVFQINEAADSIRGLFSTLRESLMNTNKSKHLYFLDYDFNPDREITQHDFPINSHISRNRLENSGPPDSLMLAQRSEATMNDSSLIFKPLRELSEVPPSIRDQVVVQMKSKLRSNIQNLENQLLLIKNRKKVMQRFEIEFHRKFALSFSIIVLFFIGAPLGAIVKRGGFGAPVVIAALIFMIYYVLITIGDEMAKNEVISPVIGMWGPVVILAPIAFLLMYSAAHDGNFKIATNFLKKKKENV